MIIIFRRFTFWLALAGLTGLVFFVHANTSIAPMPEPPLTPPRKPFEKGIGASGIVESLRENTSIGVPFAALVTEIKVKVWQKVAKGHLLMRLDDREMRIRLIGQRAELSVREAEQHRAQRQYDRLAKIGAGAAVAREDLETKEDDLLVAKANVEKAKAAIAETERNLERFLIRSPIDATILQINLREGEHATPGGSTIPIVLGSIDNLQIRADVDEQIAPRVKVGTRAVAYRKGETDKAIPLTFVRIEPYIIPKKSLTGAGSERVDTRVLPVIFSFANHEELKTYVGQQVDIFIEE